MKSDRQPAPLPVNLRATKERPVADFPDAAQRGVAATMETVSIWDGAIVAPVSLDGVAVLDLCVYLLFTLRQRGLYRATDRAIGHALGIQPEHLAVYHQRAQTQLDP
jgi:hypothetical protein